ncbi:MAG TPA: alpha-L-rhamnosidase N-terminal domain-containing protein, partial [Sedimentisphaerales bacterium]
MRTILIILCFTSLAAGNSTTGNANRFAIYLVAVPNTDINQIMPEDKPVLTAADIVSYDWNTHTMELTDNGVRSIPAAPKEVGVYGKPFVVVADEQRCYVGAFWTTISSIAYPNPVIEVPLDTKSNKVTIRRAYPFLYEKNGTKKDPRTDKRIFKVLSELGKLKSPDVNINPDLLTKRWQAGWVSHPTASLKDYGVYHFRRTFDVDSQPEKFIIHVSADNRYRLFVNGQSACRGPARGDFMHWRYETVDIAPCLVKGKNTIAAVVWNFGEFIPGAQMTLRTAFVLQADDSRNNFVDTDQKWKVIQDTAYSPVPSTLNTFNVVGPGEKIIADKYPWGWQQTDFNDSDWPSVRLLDKAVPPGVATNNTWMLVPRTIPPMEDKLQRIDKVRRTAGVEINDNFFDGQRKLTIPPNTNATILFDQTFLTTAYPELLVSSGKDSQIVLTFSEALFDPKMQKGNRDEIEGRKINGFSDTFLPDGGDNRLFSTLWFRTWRYLQMDIQTKDEPLIINDFYGRFTAYPFKENAVFASSDPSIKNIWDVGWRTARLCAGETYYDCPYYEQLQYVGDTRIQALISLYVSGDDRLMRNAIAAFDDSRVAEGLTQSRYPCSSMQIIPPYSLFWVAMVHDYWMHRDDPQFVKSYLPGIDSVLNWHERYIGANGMLGPTPWWNFVDWAWKWDTNKGIGGVPASDAQGRSSILTLQYVYALNYAAQLNDNLGRKYFADHYRQLANSLKKTTYKLCWDDKRGLLADTPDKTIFSQHANILAVLVDLVPPNEQKKLMEKVVSEK